MEANAIGVLAYSAETESDVDEGESAIETKGCSLLNVSAEALNHNFTATAMSVGMIEYGVSVVDSSSTSMFS